MRICNCCFVTGKGEEVFGWGERDCDADLGDSDDLVGGICHLVCSRKILLTRYGVMEVLF